MLDALKSDNSSLRLVARSWLIASVVHVNRIMDPLFQTLIDEETLKKGHGNPFDDGRSKYVLGLWLAMLEVDPEHFIRACMNTSLSQDVQANYQTIQATLVTDDKKTLAVSVNVKDYYGLLISTCVRLMDCGINNEITDDPEKQAQNSLREHIRSSSVVFLRNMVEHGSTILRTTEIAFALGESILSHLQIAVEKYDAVFQFEVCVVGINYNVF